MARQIRRRLNPQFLEGEALTLDRELRRTVIGQEPAIQAIVDSYQQIMGGMQETGRPAGVFLFLGPTGSGKTYAVERTAEILSGSSNICKIDCGEFQDEHDKAKMIGAPPGFIGHKDTKPFITQDQVDESMGKGKNKSPVGFVLFDEIEKAHESLRNLLLGMLDKGCIRSGDNKTVIVENAWIFFTSNLGAVEITKAMKPFGLAPPPTVVDLEKKIGAAGVQAARKRFAPEFFNRIDHIVPFRALSGEELNSILNLELEKVQQMICDRMLDMSYMFQITPDARQQILNVLDIRYGTRHLKREIRKRVIQPLGAMAQSCQIHKGDLIEIGFSNGTWTYEKVRENMTLTELGAAHKLIYEQKIWIPSLRQIHRVA